MTTAYDVPDQASALARAYARIVERVRSLEAVTPDEASADEPARATYIMLGEGSRKRVSEPIE